jgi:hypothetical protein
MGSGSLESSALGHRQECLCYLEIQGHFQSAIQFRKFGRR